MLETSKATVMRMENSLRPLAILALGLAILGACGGSSESVLGRDADHVDFQLASLDGQRLGPSDYRGRVVLFDFWATWCSPCHVQADILKAIYPEFADSGVEFVAVSIGESEATVRSFVDRRPFPYPVLVDPSEEVATRLGVFVLPTVMILDADGRIAYLQQGVSSARRLREGLAEALGGTLDTAQESQGAFGSIGAKG